MRIFDCHAHIYPEKIAAKAVEGICKFYNISMDGEGTSAALKSNGSSAGITDYLVHSVATTASSVEKINDFLHGEALKNPEFHAFGTIHHEYENKVQEAERLISMGLHGIKIHPDTQGFNMDDERMFELYDYMQGKLALLIHCGDYRYDFSHPRRLKHLLHEFPGLTVIGAHFGGWSVPDLAIEYLENENCYLDTSSSIMYTGSRRAKELIKIYGSERILFGSDFPMWKPSEELNRVMELKLTDTEYENIFYKNAMRLLNL